jgi:hypothetical protein
MSTILPSVRKHRTEMAPRAIAKRFVIASESEAIQNRVQSRVL